MRNVLIFILLTLFIVPTAFAEMKMLVGGGTTFTYYGDLNNKYVFSQCIGVSAPTSTGGTFGFLVPSETYFIFEYGTTQTDTGRIGIYSPTVKGLYYIDLLSDRWSPYLAIAIPVDIVDKEEGSVSYLTGDLGLGMLFSVNKNFGLWSDHKIVLGKEIVYDGRVGLAVTLF